MVVEKYFDNGFVVKRKTEDVAVAAVVLPMVLCLSVVGMGAMSLLLAVR